MSLTFGTQDLLASRQATCSGGPSWKRMDARGIAEAELVDGCQRSTMDELTDWAQWADEAVAF